jgi:hypothetical protein
MLAERRLRKGLGVDVRGRILLLLGLLSLASGPLEAGIFGVPTQISNNGQVCTGVGSSAGCAAAAVQPPGYLLLTGVDDVDAAGDTVHQMRFFIEVTGTTLDIRVFDAGRDGLRDEEQNNNTSYTYTLFNPAGGTIRTVTIGADIGVTQNRLARIRSNGIPGFVALNTADLPFAVTPGLYELRVTASNGATTNDRNAFGVDIRNGTAANAAHYNVYTYGTDDDTGQGGTPGVTDTSLVIGAIQAVNSGADNQATISNDMVFYPHVTRGCSFQTSNFDMDGHASANASVTNVLAGNTTLGVSGATAHTENTVTVHTTGLASGVQTDVNNYGIYSLQNDTGTQFNIIDWRLADFRNWADAIALPLDPTDPLRMYLPNGYVGGVPPLSNATAPGEPVLTASYSYVSGANPPAVGSSTRFVVQVALSNNGPAAIGLNAANDQIVGGLPTGAIGLGNIRCFMNNFFNNVGTPVNGGTFARCDFSGAGVSVASGSVVILSYEFDFTPTAAGAFFITNVPAAPTSGTYNAGGLGPNSTTWAQYSRFPTGGTVRPETLGPVCDLRAQVGTLVTRAALGGLRVDPSGEVEFTTLGQRRTAAFNVYATHDASGRGARTLLNPKPLEAPVPDSVGPLVYRTRTAPIAAPFVMLEEIETTGRSRFLGPFKVGDKHLRAALQRSESIARGRSATAQGSAANRRLARQERAPRVREASPAGLRIEVEDVGRVTVPVSELRRAGLRGRNALKKLKVTNEGGEVPFELVRNADGKVEAVAFDNLGLASPYTGTNVFIVTTAARRPRLLAELTRFDAPPPRGAFRVEKDRFYAPGAAPGSDPWVWDFAVAGTPWPRADDPDAGLFDLPELDTAPDAIVPVHVRVASVFGGVHTAEARINGVSVGSVAFAGRRGATVVGEIPASELRTIGNTLSLELTTDAVEGSLFYVGHVDVFALPRNMPAAEVVLIEPYAPSLRPRRFRGVDYLILTHADFADQARRIARIKNGQGHRAAIVDVQQAYDQYTAGITDAAAIDRLIADVARLGALRNVLLVGDDSFDPLQRLGGPGQSFVPSLYAWDGEFGRVASEVLYADVDGDLAPDVAIGRLPVSTAAEADTVVAKIARQAQASAPTGRHVFAVDNQAPGDPSFEAFAEQGRSLTGAADVAWVRISDGIDAARQALREGLGAGAPSAHFFGHGTFDALADERLVDTATVGELAGSQETPIFAWACESHGYPWPFGPSLGESLLLLPEGGASASFGPAGMTAPDVQSEFMAGVYPRFFGEGLSLGEAIRRAKAEAAQNAPGRLAPVVHGWNLLGDPSLRLSR